MPRIRGGQDELRGSLINDVAALNKVEISGWYWCERINVEPIDEPHDDLDATLGRARAGVRAVSRTSAATG
jgi:hypothetical protein